MALGVPRETTDRHGRTTRIGYDAFGREISRERAWEGVTETTSYAACTSCDAVSASASSCGTAVSAVPAMKATTETSPQVSPDTVRRYDVLGRPVRTGAQSFGSASTYRTVDTLYDAAGRVACRSVPYHAGDAAHHESYGYDARGRTTSAVRAGGGSVAIEYAARGGGGTTTTVTETVADADGRTLARKRRTTLEHDALGDLVRSVEGTLVTGTTADASGVATAFEYDGGGLLETVTVDGGYTTGFGYDDAGNRTRVANPNFAETTFLHTGLGELRERTDARGTTTWTYDVLGRTKRRVDPDGTATWDWSGPGGLLRSRSYDESPSAAVEFEETYKYDAYARPMTATATIRTTATDAVTLLRGFDHDAYGRLDTATHPAAGTAAGLTARFKYNARGYPWKIKAGAATLASYTAMDAWGNVGSATYGNGVRTTRAHDEKTGRVKDIDTGRGTATLQDESYGWRSDGLLQTRERGTDAEAFVHDGLGRLKSATAAYAGADGSTATRTLTYGYDDLGNVTSKTGGPTSYAYGDAARPTRLTGVTLDGVATTLAYEENAGGDATGHVAKYDAATGDDTFVSWNGRGLPTAVTLGASTATATPTARDEFRYGPDGERYYRKTTWTEETTDDAGATTTRTRTAHAYRIGGYERIVGDAHAEYATVEKTRAGAALLVRRTARTGASPAPAFEYVHADHLGSTAAVSDASGASLLELAHDPYGTRREADWSGALAGEDVAGVAAGQDAGRTRRGFTGHEQLDRTGLVHMGGRLYDPRIGRFPSPDPVVSEPWSGQAWNGYGYVGNSPVSYTDPTGLFRAGPGCNVAA